MSRPEKDLQKLLQGLHPKLNDGNYVFCSVPDATKLTSLPCIGSFRESEGTTFILSRDIADRYRMSYDLIFCWITITVHSALDAYGLTAAIATALADAEISCNVVAGYYHDHLFIPQEDGLRAMGILKNLQNAAGR